LINCSDLQGFSCFSSNSQYFRILCWIFYIIINISIETYNGAGMSCNICLYALIYPGCQPAGQPGSKPGSQSGSQEAPGKPLEAPGDPQEAPEVPGGPSRSQEDPAGIIMNEDYITGL